MLEDKSRLAGMTLLQVNVHIVKVFKSSLLISPELLQFFQIRGLPEKDSPTEYGKWFSE